jgi:hypothetical protein
VLLSGCALSIQFSKIFVPTISRDKKYLRFSFRIEDTFGLQLEFREKSIPIIRFIFRLSMRISKQISFVKKFVLGATEGGDLGSPIWTALGRYPRSLNLLIQALAGFRDKPASLQSASIEYSTKSD